MFVLIFVFSKVNLQKLSINGSGNVVSIGYTVAQQKSILNGMLQYSSLPHKRTRSHGHTHFLMIRLNDNLLRCCDNFIIFLSPCSQHLDSELFSPHNFYFYFINLISALRTDFKT